MVQYGAGIMFDQLLKEGGGQISGEAMQHDTKMLDAVIEMLVQFNQQVVEESLNPYRDQNGEIPPTNVERTLMVSWLARMLLHLNSILKNCCHASQCLKIKYYLQNL